MTPPPQPSARTISLADVTPQSVRWLWPGRVPLGKLSCLGGLPGQGKSFITMTLAAAVTKGRPVVPGEPPCPSGSVLLLSAEDDLADTVRPRLEAALADLERVLAMDMVETPQGGLRGVSLVSDVPLIEGKLQALGDCRLIVIDPLTAFLGVGEVDSHRDADMRGVLRPLSDMAARWGCAVLIVAHHRKGSGGSADYRMAGSLGVVAACRSVLHVTDHPDVPDCRLLAPGKSNLGRPAPALRYAIVGDGAAAMVVWQGTDALTAEDLLGEQSTPSARKVDCAVEWLQDVLAAGPVLAATVQARANEAGITDRTLRRARKDAHVTATREGYGGQGRWWWSIDVPHPAQTDWPPMAGRRQDKASAVDDAVATYDAGIPGQAA